METVMTVVDDDDVDHVSSKTVTMPSTFQNGEDQNIQNNFDSCFEWVKTMSLSSSKKHKP
jgi:hypothetical protein